MADDPAPDTIPTGTADDIDIIKSPTRGANIDAIAAAQSDSYRSALQGQQLQRQHRTALAQVGAITLPNDVSTTTIPPAAGAYTQADIQVMVNELAALRQIVAQQSIIFASIKTTMIDNIQKLT